MATFTYARMFTETSYLLQTAYYHFRQFTEHGVWQLLWIRFLALHKQHVSTTIVQLDGSHTIAKCGG
jgi:hypothetical protein